VSATNSEEGRRVGCGRRNCSTEAGSNKGRNNEEDLIEQH